MEKWAFATSVAPYGLGLSGAEFWFLSHEEYGAKVKCWSRHHDSQNEVIYALRADIHNSSENLNRSDKQRWTPQDFGAEEPKQAAMSEEFRRAKTRTNMIMRFGAGNKSVLGNLKGQVLPAELAAKVG